MKPYLVLVVAAWVACLAALQAQPTPAPQRKPPLGIPPDATLFNGKWYKVYIEKSRWNDARAKCTSLGGQLAVIPDEATQNFVRTFAKGLELWLGATDEKVEGLWVWVDGTEMTYKAWGYRQPDNVGGKENYLQIWADGSWNDLPIAHKSPVGFICQWKDK